MSIELVMPSNHLILHYLLLLLPLIFPSIRVISNESVPRIRWSKYCSFSISPSNEYLGLISFRIDWFDLLARRLIILDIDDFLNGFPGDTVVKNLPANTGDLGSIPGLGRSPNIGNGNPLQYSCLENPMGRGSWQVTVYGVTKNWTWMSDWAQFSQYLWIIYCHHNRDIQSDHHCLGIAEFTAFTKFPHTLVKQRLCVLHVFSFVTVWCVQRFTFTCWKY